LEPRARVLLRELRRHVTARHVLGRKSHQAPLGVPRPQRHRARRARRRQSGAPTVGTRVGWDRDPVPARRAGQRHAVLSALVGRDAVHEASPGAGHGALRRQPGRRGVRGTRCRSRGAGWGGALGTGLGGGGGSP
jgi:hypothetical protein